MLIGTYLHKGTYIGVAVELDRAERPLVVLERQDRPGEATSRCGLVASSFGAALRHAESHLLRRGGLPGAEAQGLASSPVDRELAWVMFSGRRGERFVHVPVRPRGPGPP